MTTAAIEELAYGGPDCREGLAWHDPVLRRPLGLVLNSSEAAAGSDRRTSGNCGNSSMRMVPEVRRDTER